jgi:hypothetical protein
MSRIVHTTTRSPRYLDGPGAELPIARIVALLLILLPLGAFWVASNVARAGPSPEAVEIANFNPKTLLQDNTPHFLPTPVAALPPQIDAGAPAPSADEPAAAEASNGERVKIANTGRAGAILRSDPASGRQVAALRDGMVLDVIEHQQMPDGSEWLHVKTADGFEGWVYSRLVAPAD